ncbi:hypothetical protein NCS55_01430500 [Fusarium keratoplasticum]|nr:hypothetical protein NCS55_01430500 [Fusarium keratoplasticum]
MSSSSGSYYHYEPSLPAAVVFSCLFGSTSLLHLYQLWRTRTWFWTVFLVGGIFETFGYAARAENAVEGLGNMTFATVVISNIGIILAPILFAASIYMTLGRIVLISGKPQLSLIKPKWLTKLFVCGDILAFLVQASGVSMLTSEDPEKIDRGRTIMVVGLWVQIAFFGFFIITALLFWRAMSKQPAISSSPAPPWRKHIIVLLTASLAVLIRCVFRVVEYMQGPDGELISTEAYVYVFDAALMLIVMIIFHAYHPREVGCWLYGGKMISLFKVRSAQYVGLKREEREGELLCVGPGGR